MVYTIARTKLNLSEKEFWDSNFDKINAMLEALNDAQDERMMKRRKVNVEDEDGLTPIDCVDFL